MFSFSEFWGVSVMQEDLSGAWGLEEEARTGPPGSPILVSGHRPGRVEANDYTSLASTILIGRMGRKEAATA